MNVPDCCDAASEAAVAKKVPDVAVLNVNENAPFDNTESIIAATP